MASRLAAPKLAILLIPLALLAPVTVRAGKHPVALDKNADPATCAECHKDKAQGKVTHSALAAGCTACHEVRVNREITRVKLITTTPHALCFTCHADKNPAGIKGRVHQPAIRDCQKCHDPHVAENEKQLLKPTAGAKGENLCLDCHDTGTRPVQAGSRHAALDMGCNTCHLVHKTGDSGKSEFDSHLTKPSPALCTECHAPGDPKLAEAHKQQPFSKSDCLLCHDPHESERPKLLQKFVHQPFADGMCDVCHQAPKDGRVVLTQAEPKTLCVTCHEETAKQIAAATVPHAGAMGDCTQCHDAHAGKRRGFARPDPVTACTACHADQAAMRSTKKVLHQPAFEEGCATCHAPHGGDKPKLLRAEGNALCLNCHSNEIKPQKVANSNQVSIFEGSVKLPANYFNRVTRLNLKYGLGHPTANHPVSDYTDPLDSTKVTKMNCLTCHNPHAGAATGLLVTDTRPTLQFCRKCHQGMIGAR